MVSYDVDTIVTIILLFAAILLAITWLVCYLTKRPLCQKTTQSNEKNVFVKISNCFLKYVFVTLPQIIDAIIRCGDFWLSKSYGHNNIVFREGHPKSAYILIFLVLVFLFGGLNPEWNRYILYASAAALLVTILISWAAALLEKCINKDTQSVFLGYIRFHALHFVSSLSILLLSVIIWCYLEFSDDPVFFYKHIHIPIITVLLVLTFVGILIRCVVFKNPKNFCDFADDVKNTQLVKEHKTPSVSWATAAYGLLTGPTYHIWTFLLLPSWIIVLLPTNWMTPWIFIPLFLVSWLLLTLCTVHQRLHFFLSFLRRWFLTGGQLIVSLVIIVLAISRAFDFSYVSTLLDGAPFKNVLFFMVAAYSSLLIYEYWNNSLLCHHLMCYLRKNQNPNYKNLSRIAYRYEEEKEESPKYCIQLFSGARFALVEWEECGYKEIKKEEDEENENKAKQNNKSPLVAIYEKRELFEVISKQNKSLRDVYSDLSKRVLLYFTLQNIVLIAVVAVMVLWVLAQEPRPIVSAKLIKNSEETAQKIDLKQLVLEDPSKESHVIFLATSGGGTRAAIYTTALLAALRERDQLDNVVLASGVSGGGMSLAYFAANREYLLEDSPKDCSSIDRVKSPNAWCDYVDVVADNHIRYVASRVGNTEIYTNTSLGQYLADSFETSFAIHDGRKEEINKQKNYYTKLDELQGLGLILNTSLVAHPFGESEILNESLSQFEKEENKKKDLFYKINAGGRLIFSNIKNLGEFPGLNSENRFIDAKDVEFKYLIGGGEGIPIYTIGALTANFPPVFPNAIVKLDDKRFRVTDGGAVENRGLISLLYAVRSMLEDLEPAELNKLPFMHIVMAEASGESIDYKNYMTGLTVRGNSNVMIANQLILELKDALKRKCGTKCMNKLQFHYLSMPLMMRARGGLGTHWKMPSHVEFKVPAESEKIPDVEVKLSGAETICLMQELFTNDIENRSSPMISVELSMNAKHEKCSKTPVAKSKTQDPRAYLHAAFLDKTADLQEAWGRMQMELEKK